MNIFKTPCIDLKINGFNVVGLKEGANDFIDQLERKGSDLGELGELLLWSRRERMCSLTEIEIAFKQFLIKKYPNRKVDTTISHINFKESGLGDADGCIVTIDDENVFGCIILLDENIKKIEPDLTKSKQEDLIQAYHRVMKLVYLHEIGHVLLKHDNFSLHPRYARGALTSFASSHAKNDVQCDLLSYVLAFWPLVGSEGFRTLVNGVYNKWERCDIRECLANFYKMPINAVAHWIVIMLNDPYQVHYARLMMTEPEPGQIVDCFDCKDVVRSIDADEERHTDLTEDEAAKQLFVLKNKDTSAKKVLAIPHSDHKMVHKELQLKCAAFFEDARLAYNRSSDEIVVIGLAPHD